MKHLGGHTWQATEPLSIEIGRPAIRPSPDALSALRDAVSDTGATLVYWFWVSVAGDPPHLGLAVAPNDPEIEARVGRKVEPIWTAYSPKNSMCDIFRLGEHGVDIVILKEGELLFGAEGNA